MSKYLDSLHLKKKTLQTIKYLYLKRAPNYCFNVLLVTTEH